uniref:Integrator complex subunit 10 n=1 Tax=Ciona savignyi TaxID=51511 RepID=H2Y982_CIOSA
MAGYCEWTKDPSNGNTLVERGNFMKELFRRSRTDVEDTINRKQIFYSTIILLLEAASKHMLLVEPHIYEERDDSSSYIVIEDIDTEVSTLIESSVKQSQELRETFHVAKDAWMILHTNETFEKDFHHLARRWKCERWYWLQLFLIQLQTFNGNYKAVLSRLASLQLKSDAMQSNVILQRICTHLVSTHFALGQLNESCRFIFQSVPLFPTDPTTPKVGHVTRISPLTEVGKPAFELAIPGTPTQRKLKLEKLKFDNLIAYWVQILITSLRLRSQNVENDHILGHLLVLCQHDWPKWKGDADKVLQKIEEKQSFSFDIFYTYIINIALLEEIAYLKKRKGCQMNFGSNLQTKVHVTRGANREVEDDFWSSMKRNVQRSDESVNLLLRDYLITCQESIASSLAMLET